VMTLTRRLMGRCRAGVQPRAMHLNLIDAKSISPTAHVSALSRAADAVPPQLHDVEVHLFRDAPARAASVLAGAHAPQKSGRSEVP
jgi:hypothetical protein